MQKSDGKAPEIVQLETDTETALTENRQFWMSVLARSNCEELRKYWIEHVYAKEDFSNRYSYIRQPETGLVMSRGRAGGQGRQFNLGEVTTTRCSVILDSGEIGHAYILGRDVKHAEFSALFDAVLQIDTWQSLLLEKVINPIHQRLAANRKEREQKVASTKVDFFAMVRGEA
ncbi:phosphonate C-P lyase system protein PhnG [Curvivirga sp.]|uniref:phosphonate C-P lyase system protein PhnG n=1 Tax=Curvivirga sp. TaxID=2856848 RepID=UPI003B58DBA9